MKQFRQGDVLIVATDKMPTDVTPVPGDGKITTIMLGEATGHHHSFYEPVEFTEQQRTGRRFLRLVEPVALRHQEHDPIEIPGGTYEVLRQNEYEDEGWRKVTD